jgi:hypothetical protein
MSTSGSGFVNSILTCAQVAALSEFQSFAVVYGEFFIQKMRCNWYPQSRYGAPVGFVNTTLTTASNLPLIVCDLQHGSAASTAAAAARFITSKQHSTGDPFVFTWKNTSDPKSKTVTAPGVTSTPSQEWAMTDATSSSFYTGAVAFISQSVTAMPATQILGQFLVEWDILFRNRL